LGALLVTQGAALRNPEPAKQSKLHRGLFLDEIKEMVGQARRPRLIVDLTSSGGIKAETIDLLLECVEEVEHADGRVVWRTSWSGYFRTPNISKQWR